MDQYLGHHPPCIMHMNECTEINLVVHSSVLKRPEQDKMDTVPSSKIYVPLSQNTTTNSDIKTSDHHSEDQHTEYIYICVLVLFNYIIFWILLTQ